MAFDISFLLLRPPFRDTAGERDFGCCRAQTWPTHWSRGWSVVQHNPPTVSVRLVALWAIDGGCYSTGVEPSTFTEWGDLTAKG
jgi:hypothetical protein